MKPAQLPEGHEELRTPGEVARIFNVDAKTVARWAAAGKIGCVKTPGGHRRYRDSEIQAFLAGLGQEDPA
jgi:excisionase family DNA binding protein